MLLLLPLKQHYSQKPLKYQQSLLSRSAYNLQS
jgi:hypothetical protein